MINLYSRKSRGIYGTIFICTIFIFAQSVLAQSPVSLTIDTAYPGNRIPDDFSGLSIETGSLRSGNGGVLGNWLDDSTQFPSNFHAQMITLFNNLGIKNIRVGGGSVDLNNTIPTNADRDAFFRFVKATGLSVEYSLRLLNGSITTDTTIAKYVWTNYSKYIRNFEIGNEPDFHSYHTYPGHVVDTLIYESSPGVPGSAFPSYMADWKKFAAAVSNAIPDAMFGGPDAGSNYPVPSANGTYSDTYYNGLPWTVQFMDSTKSLGNVTGIYFHNYVGGGVTNQTAQSMANAMLSAAWDNTYYPDLYNSSCVPVLKAGLPYRLTESNSFTGGLTDGSTCYATALFALDYMHWWAAHDASGVNFHNKQWVLNDTIYRDSNGNYQVHPMGYGITAFKIGGHGVVDSVAISNPDDVDLTAYAVQDSSGELFVTVINKEHNTNVPYAPAPKNALVRISAPGLSDTASAMFLTAPNRNALDQSGVTLGGATIGNNKPFVGKWSAIDTARAGYYVVNLPRTTAAIVRIGGPFRLIKNPRLYSPSGDSGVPRLSQFRWGSSAGATGYEFQLSSDSTFKTVTFDTTTSAGDTTFQLSSPLTAGTGYYWRVIASDSLYTSSYAPMASFTTGAGLLSVRQALGIPLKFALSQNYPNPFNPSTQIKFSLDRAGNMSLGVYDALGQLVDMVADGYKPAGEYVCSVNMNKFASGIYFYTLRQGTNVITKKMLLLK